MRDEWDGTWHMVIYSVPETDRGIRDRIRKELAWLGFGPLAPSTYICPHNRVQQVYEKFTDEPVVRLDTLRCQSRGLTVDREMAARCWDLDGLNEDYRELLRTYRVRLPTYRAGHLRPQEALIERMQLTYDYRKFPFRDPDLPLELLPGGWVGRDTHEMFLEAHALLGPPAERFYEEIAGISTPAA